MRILAAIIALLLAFIISFAAVFFGLGFWLSPQDKLTHSDVIVAVSGGETDARAREAAKLYQQGLAPIIVFSGAAQDASGPSNAAAMRQIALDMGVPPDAIEIEERSQNTAQNALDVAPLVRSLNVSKIILVTSPYHQRRASIEFARALGPNVKILNHSAPDQSWRRTHWWATDYSYKLTMTELQKTLYVLTTKSEAQTQP